MEVINQIAVERIYGPFFGSSLDFNQCEILAIQHIDHKLLKLESNLYARKWFDYRPLHPTMATYLLTHHYNRAYGNFMATCFERGKGAMVGFKGKDFMNTREKKSFWKLRQKIDELGIRYEFFVREAMNWCVAHGWRQPPRPAHISSNDDLIVDVCNAWERECRAKLQFAKADRYLTAEFVGAPDQIAYEDWLLERIMQRPHPKYGLHAALYIYDALRIEAALWKLPEAAVNDAVLFALN